MHGQARFFSFFSIFFVFFVFTVKKQVSLFLLRGSLAYIFSQLLQHVRSVCAKELCSSKPKFHVYIE